MLPSILNKLLPAFVRLKPSFIVIGAAKCGTTSLYYYLVQHPQIASAREKEIGFFNKRHLGNIRYYYKFFPVLARLKNIFLTKKIITGEASTMYCYAEYAASRIKHYFPHIKLIILLRNPKERAYSQFKARDDYPPSFKESLDIELKDKIRNIAAGDHYWSFSFLRKGEYYKQIKRYEVLFPRENFLILKSEDFFANPKAILKQTFKFLAVDKNFIPKDLNPQNLNEGKSFTDKEYLEIEGFLDNYFAEKNQKLYDYLKQKFNLKIRW